MRPHHDVVLLVTGDGLGHHGLDAGHGHLLGALLGADPELVTLELERQPHLAAGPVQHARQRRRRQGLLLAARGPNAVSIMVSLLVG